MEGLSRLSQNLTKGALRTGLLLGVSTLIPRQSEVKHDVQQVLEEDCLTSDLDKIDLKNIQASNTARRQLLKKHPQLAQVLRKQEDELKKSIEKHFDEDRPHDEIAELSSYDYLFRHHLPPKYEGQAWNLLPAKIQAYLKYLRFFAAQEIHLQAHCNDTQVENLIGKVMASQITTESPKQAVNNAYSLPPFNKGGYVPFAEREMPKGENVEIKEGRWRTPHSSHHIESLGIVVGAQVLYLHSGDYLSLTPENNAIVDGSEGLYAFAQPGPDEWCQANLIITELRPIPATAAKDKGDGGSGSDFMKMIQSGKEVPKSQIQSKDDLASNETRPTKKKEAHPKPEDTSELKSKTRPIRKITKKAPGKIPFGRNPGNKTLGSGGVCVVDHTSRSNDPFDRIRRQSGRTDVHSIAGTSRHEFCQWLGIPGNMRFTVQMVKGMPTERPVYLAWQNPKQCKKASSKGNFCITLSDSPLAVSRSMADTLTRNHPRSVHVKMWDRDTKELIINFHTKPRQ